MSVVKGVFAKVYRSLWDGTLAGQEPAGWVVFVFLLAHADADGVVDMTPGAISRRSGLPLDFVKDGLHILESPDPDSRSAAESGCRIVRLADHRDWGWQIVNYAAYRAGTNATTARVRKHREHNKHETPRNASTQDVTPCNTMEREAEAEAEAEAEKTPLRPSQNLGTTQTRDVGAAQELAGLPLLPPGPGDAVVIALPLKTGGVFPITERDVQAFQAMYPAIDVRRILTQNIASWCAGEKSKGATGALKTKRGIESFLHTWFRKDAQRVYESRKGGARVDQTYQPPVMGGPTPEQTGTDPITKHLEGT